MTGINRLLAIVVLSAVSLTGMAQEGGGSRDDRALNVLKQMSEYKDSFEQWVINGNISIDSRLDEGLLVANPEEVTISLKRSGSLHFLRFDGIGTKELYIHAGRMTVFDSATGFYAQADTPDALDPALDFALETFDIDMPLMDLLQEGTFEQLANPADEILYLSDKSRVGGVDCHHIAIRSPDVDIQIWVEDGAAPLPRRIIITDKWEGGAPRLVANMAWDTAPTIPANRFRFSPPEGSSEIQFVEAIAD